MPVNRPSRALALTALLATALAAPLHSAAQSGVQTTRSATPGEASAGSEPTGTAKPKKKKTSGSVKYDKGSAETTAERDRRLKRECKGRPNAGACLGYAH